MRCGLFPWKRANKCPRCSVRDGEGERSFGGFYRAEDRISGCTWYIQAGEKIYRSDLRKNKCGEHHVNKCCRGKACTILQILGVPSMERVLNQIYSEYLVLRSQNLTRRAALRVRCIIYGVRVWLRETSEHCGFTICGLHNILFVSCLQ